MQSTERYLLPALYAVVVFLGLRDLSLKPALAKALHVAVTVIVVVQAVRLALRIAQELLEKQMGRRGDPGAVQSLKGILALIKVVVWALALILTLDNLGIKVTTFVAGLGITGIAVALAAQAVLGDLFSYFVIFFDRPFQIGHFIKVGNFLGVVESIGIKTTRLRSLSGEEIVMSNKYLTDNQVQNYGHMARRRALFLFEVEYGTAEDTLKAIPGVVKELFGAFSDATFDRAHFKEFGDSGLRYEVVYYVESPDYNRYMDIQQELNLGIKRKLEALGVAFAFPTRTVLMVKDQGPLP
jgi:small-conductance mechanosensitive channel